MRKASKSEGFIGALVAQAPKCPAIEEVRRVFDSLRPQVVRHLGGAEQRSRCLQNRPIKALWRPILLWSMGIRCLELNAGGFAVLLQFTLRKHTVSVSAEPLDGGSWELSLKVAQQLDEPR